MKVEMSNTKRILCLISIMLTSIAVMADLVIIPVISNLYQAFPDQVGIVNYIVSGPMLIIVGATLLATFLLKKLSKKIVIVAGGVIFTVGAIGGIILDSAIFMAVMRTLVGIGAGLVNVVGVALIADLYEDEIVRAKIMGYYNASLSLIGMVFSYFSGIIAAASIWQNSFKLYWSAVPMLIMLIIFVPSIRPVTAEETDTKLTDKSSKEPLGWRYWTMAISWLIMNILFGATVLYYISPYIVENGIGDSAFAGLATSVKQIVGFLICLGFGFIYAKLKKNTNVVCCLVAAASIIIMILAPSQFAAIVLGTIGGCAYKIAFSYAYAHGFVIAPKSRIEDAVAITTAVYGIGSFLSTYFATWLMQVMKTDMFTETWIVSAGLFLLLAVVEIIKNIKDKTEFTVKVT
jgi:MFS family permease